MGHTCQTALLFPYIYILDWYFPKCPVGNIARIMQAQAYLGSNTPLCESAIQNIQKRKSYNFLTTITIQFTLTTEYIKMRKDFLCFVSKDGIFSISLKSAIITAMPGHNKDVQEIGEPPSRPQNTNSIKLNLLYDFTLFGIDMHQILRFRFLKHFHFHPTFRLVPDLILTVCL